MDLIVGTFNTPHLYTLRFTPPFPVSNSTNSTNTNINTNPTPADLQILARHPAIGSHSWLSLDSTKSHLYATAWTEPPSIAAYRLDLHPKTGITTPTLINNAPLRARSGYVCVSSTHVYSAGGPTGEVFTLRPDGGLGACVQELSFVDEISGPSAAGGQGVKHGDFGGLRHGAHSADLSPDGRSLYIADIGRNCVWTYRVASLQQLESGKDGGVQPLTLGSKHIAPRSNDGPRHTTPHPNGRVLYSLQEHSCMVDVFATADDGVSLTHRQGVRIIPSDKDEKKYWADEVRVGASEDGVPKYLYASTRGLEKDTKGYVAVFAVDAEGNVVGEALDIWETPTSGGWANAVEPAPGLAEVGVQWLALTDSEEGWVFMLSFDGKRIAEVARCKLEPGDVGTVAGAATAVWL